MHQNGWLMIFYFLYFLFSNFFMIGITEKQLEFISTYYALTLF